MNAIWPEASQAKRGGKSMRTVLLVLISILIVPLSASCSRGGGLLNHSESRELRPSDRYAAGHSD